MSPAELSIVAAPEAPEGHSTDWQAAARRFHRRLLASVLALGVRYDRAEEIVQDAWSALIEAERAGRLTRIELPGLALAQARFLALHELRRGGLERRLLAATDERALQVVDDAADPEAELLRRQRSERLLRALERFPEPTQRLFRALYADAQPSYADLAGRLGLSLQRVRQIACELRRLVRETITEEEG